ncbi:MAG: glycosyltransferase [Cetobacterium sp.]
MRKIREKEPLVSIAILTYNQEKFIQETIESCLKQTYKNLQIVIGDDASSDKTKEILLEYKKKFPNIIKLVLNKKNLGITKNVNNILKNCNGKYISWLGGDDRFLENKIEKQVNYLEDNPDKVLCFHKIRVFDNKTNLTLRYLPNKKLSLTLDTDSLLLQGCYMGGCSVFHRNLSIYCNEKIGTASDWLNWIEISYHGKIGYIDEILSEYRRHDMNITKVSKLEDIYKERLLTLNEVQSSKLTNPNSLIYGRIRVEIQMISSYLKNKNLNLVKNHLENINKISDLFNYNKKYFIKILILKVLFMLKLEKVMLLIK